MLAYLQPCKLEVLHRIELELTFLLSDISTFFEGADSMDEFENSLLPWEENKVDKNSPGSSSGATALPTPPTPFLLSASLAESLFL